MMKYADTNSLIRFLNNMKTILNTKSNVNHTHEYVNGLKLVVSTTKPTTNDKTIITFVR